MYVVFTLFFLDTSLSAQLFMLVFVLVEVLIEFCYIVLYSGSYIYLHAFDGEIYINVRGIIIKH